MLGGDSEREPPDTISNSVVKTLSADDSVGFPHVKIGHRQALFLAMWPKSSSDCIQCDAGSGERYGPATQPAGVTLLPINKFQFNDRRCVLCDDVSGNKTDTCAGFRQARMLGSEQLRVYQSSTESVHAQR